MHRYSITRVLRRSASLQASPVFCCLVSVMLFAAPVALAAPVRTTEVNNTLPAEEETKPTSSVGATQSQTRHRTRHISATFVPVLKSICIITGIRAQTRAPFGLSEHAHREGLGTPLRC